MKIDLMEVQSRLQFTTSIEDVKRNHALLAETLSQVNTARKLVSALMTANHSMCSHSTRSSLGDGDWACGDCGYST